MTKTRSEKLRNCSPVSVIMVVRNGAAFIGESLSSVLNSKFKPLEILVVDGGSTDHTEEIARGFPFVKFVPQESTGIANAYNLGIEHAKGDLLAFISHDDIWEPSKLDIQLDFMQSNQEIQYTVTMVQHFLEPGLQIPPGFRAELLEKSCVGLIMEALMARKTVFDTIGLFNPNFEVGEDTDWFARAKDAGVAMAVLPQTLVRKRVHGSNASLNSKKINQLLLRAMRSSVHRKRRELM